MTDPYAAIDANYDKMYDMADAAENCYSTICQDLLNDRMAIYRDNKFKRHTVYLDQLLDEHAEEIEDGMNTKDVIEAEAKRIAESIF